jgi:molecular chaperone DnaK (HSP70)
VEHAIDDLNQRQLVEFRNTAEAVFRGIEKVWEESRALLSEPQQAEIRAQMERVREQAQGSDPLPLKREMDRLGELTQPLADAIIGKAALSELRRFYEETRPGG